MSKFQGIIKIVVYDFQPIFRFAIQLFAWKNMENVQSPWDPKNLLIIVDVYLINLQNYQTEIPIEMQTNYMWSGFIIVLIFILETPFDITCCLFTNFFFKVDFR